MKIDDVKKCLNELSCKKCEGFDRIPVCAINDARAVLLNPLSLLFEKNLFIATTCIMRFNDERENQSLTLRA